MFGLSLADNEATDKIKVYMFLSSNDLHLKTAVQNSCWAIRVNKMSDLATKARFVSVGDLGMFYKTRTDRKAGYCWCPFVFESVPSDDFADKVAHLWPGDEWNLGFQFSLVGGKSKITEPYLKGLKCVKDGQKAGYRWNDVLRLSARCTFVPAELMREDWENLLKWSQ